MFWTIVGFISVYLCCAWMFGIYKLLKLKELEKQFVIGSLHFEQFKHQMLQVLELVYEKAEETDPEFKEDYKRIKIQVEEMFTGMGNEWIKNLEKTVGYKLNYNNWKELITTATHLLKKH